MEDNNPKFSFLPWVRQGIAANIKQEEGFGNLDGPLQSRASVTFRVAIDAVPVGGGDYEHAGEDITQEIQVFGPGEVIGINRSAIVNTDPKPGITDYEPNYLPYVEFYEENFPWSYTPARAVNSRLRPWLILLVLERSEFEIKEFPEAPLRAITHGENEIPFPDESQTWAWAHVHINETLDQSDQNPDFGKQLFNIVNDVDPNLASSRIVSSRYLKENTPYRAFLIPAFEQGRLAGLGASDERIIAEDVRKSSWGEHEQDEFANAWPFYFDWEFHTGDRVDFESLVRMIDPVVLDDKIGRKPMDCSDAGYEIKYTGQEQVNPDDRGVLELEGALQSPIANFAGEKTQVLGVANDEKKAFLKRLKEFLNLNTDLLDDQAIDNFYINELEALFPGDMNNNPDDIDDPIVLPPLYGQWHAEKNRIDYDVEAPVDSSTEIPNKDISWFNHANLDPRNRAAAGLGTRVVQKNQESYMDRAWEQVGDVLNAIRNLRLADLSIEASIKLCKKYYEQLDPLAFTSLTQSIHSKVIYNSGQTIASSFTNTVSSPTLVNHALNKVARPNGPLFRRLNSEVTANEVTNSISENFESIGAAPEIANYGSFSTTVLDFSEGGDVFDSGPLDGGIFGGNDWGNLDLDFIDSILNVFQGQIAPRNITQNNNNLTNNLIDYFAEENWDPYFEGSALPQEQDIDYQDLKVTVSEKIDPKKVITNKAWNGVKILQKPADIIEDEDDDGSILLFNNRISNRGISAVEASQPEEIMGVLAYPEFQDPMYKALQDLSEDYFLPGIERIPENSFSILSTNQRFIEAFLLGINHEMSRELLWREYPTDQKGSYFRKFWENIDGMPEANEFDIKEITSWTKAGPDNNLAALGCNHPGGTDANNRVVVSIRGDLLKKFPNTVIYLQKAFFIKDSEDANKNMVRTLGTHLDRVDLLPAPADDIFPNGEERPETFFPIFRAKAEPDITFLGFDITPVEANGDRITQPGYFIVVKERPGEPRFGFDIPSDEARSPDAIGDPDPDEEFTWNDGNWQHIGLDPGGNYIQLDQEEYAANGGITTKITKFETEKLQWGKNAAHMAGIMYQLPFMIAIHADVMISNEILDHYNEENNNC